MAPSPRGSEHLVVFIHSKETEYLEFHASGASNPVVEAKHNDTGHQGGQDKGRRLHAATSIPQSYHLRTRAENLPNKNTLRVSTLRLASPTQTTAIFSIYRKATM